MPERLTRRRFTELAAATAVATVAGCGEPGDGEEATPTEEDGSDPGAGEETPGAGEETPGGDEETPGAGEETPGADGTPAEEDRGDE